MKSNREIKKEMKKAISIDRGKLIGISSVSIFLGGVSFFCFILVQLMTIYTSAGLHMNLYGEATDFAKIVYIGLAIHLLLAVAIGGCIELGFNRIALLRVRQEPVNFSTLFYYKSIWFNSLILRVLMTIKAILWFLIFVIPGFVAILNYILAPYVLSQKPGLTPLDAIKISKHLMKGYRLKLFLLLFSFLDEIIISILALGIPFIYVIPRMKTAIAVFYRNRVAMHDSEVRDLIGLSANGE